MQQPISRRMHGLADYGYMAAASMAPSIGGFEHDRAAADLCRTMAGATMLSSAMTRSEWGLVRLLPFRAHLALDAGLGVLALAAPWLMGFSHDRRARNAFLMLGAGTLAATVLTRPEEMGEEDGGGVMGRMGRRGGERMM